MLLIFFSLWGAFWNRARGSQIYGLCTSTTEGRIIAMLMLSVAASCYSALHKFDDHTDIGILIWSFATLMLWCVPAWEKYTSAAMGFPVPIKTTAFFPVDLIMKLWPSPAIGWQMRLWGFIATTLRMFLIAPCFAGISYALHDFNAIYYAFGALALGVPYYVFAYLFPNNQNVTMYSELSVGSMIGALLLKSMGG